MGVLTRDEFFAKLHERIGEDTSDEAITFLEDMTDTYNDMEKRVNGDGTDWEKKYHELDESWKKRYRHRFFNGGDKAVVGEGETAEVDDKPDAEEITIEDLFEEKKED